ACFGREDYREVADANADFILSTLWDGARLLHTYKDGRARLNGYLDDYANLADGLFALYELTFDYKRLEAAVHVSDRMIEQFWGGNGGGVYFAGQGPARLSTGP